MILFDGRPLDGASGGRGIGTYSRGLLNGLAEVAADRAFALLLASDQPSPPEAELLRLDVVAARLRRLHPTLQPLADPVLVGAAVRRVRPALYHALEWGQPLCAPCPVVVTVHDLIPFVFPDDYPWVRRSRVPALRLLRRAAAVITPSVATARDVMRFGRVPEPRIAVVPEGVAPEFAPASDDAVRSMRDALGLRRPYVLTVGTFDPRKRIGVVAQALAMVQRERDIDFVVAGDQGTFAPHVRHVITAAGIAERSHVVGHVSLGHLVALYSGAACFVLPSAYEGFGLPPLEAMACGAPVVMFANSSLVEVAGPATLVRPDGDAAALAGAVARTLDQRDDTGERSAGGRAWAARFTWPRAASETLSVYDRVLAPSLAER